MWNKNKLKLQLNFLEKNKEFKIIYSNYTIFNEVTNKKHDKYNRILNSGFITQSLLNDYTMGILTVLIDKTIIGKKCFNNSYNIIGDFDYFLKLSLTNKIAYIPQPLGTYRIHENNYSTTNLKEYTLNFTTGLKKLLQL